MKLYLLILITLISFFIDRSICFANEQSFYPNIPKVFWKYFEKPFYIYLASISEVLTENSEDKKALTEADIKRLDMLEDKKRIQSQNFQFSEYDTDHDKFVTKTELKEYLEKKALFVPPGGNFLKLLNQYSEDQRQKFYPGIEKSITRTFSFFDQNKDEKISYLEMQTPDRSVKFDTPQREFYNLDPNNDKKLTLEELQSMATKYFKMLDKNNDDFVSQEEFNLYGKFKKTSELSP